MQYAHLNQKKLLNFSFEKNEIPFTIECNNIIDYLVDINNYDIHFKAMAIKYKETHIVDYTILKNNKSIIKVYTSKGDIWIRQQYSGKTTGK